MYVVYFYKNKSSDIYYLSDCEQKLIIAVGFGLLPQQNAVVTEGVPTVKAAGLHKHLLAHGAVEVSSHQLSSPTRSLALSSREIAKALSYPCLNIIK